jgi:hypothetical protein
MTTAAVSRNNRSKVTNDPRLIRGVDGRSAAGRRRRDLVDALITSLGGIAQVSPLRLAQVRRAAELQALAEEARAKAFTASAGASELETVIRLENLANRAQRALGLKEQSSAGPTLAEYLAEHYGQPADASEADEPA